MNFFKRSYQFLTIFLFTINTHIFAEDSLKEDDKSSFLNIVNYNSWHGIGEGFLKREEMEPPYHRIKRYKKQMDDFKKDRFDIIFLQEVNPVEKRTKKMAEELGMSYVFQNTNCGISVLGVGIPVNLDMGIAILADPSLKIEKIEGVKLSGPLGGCNRFVTFQYAEFRYALFALVKHPKYGHIILINTHFHHGVQWSDRLRKQINIWQEQHLLTDNEIEELKERIDKSNARREEELANLFDTLKQIQKDYDNLPVIFAGDLNSTVDSPIYKKIIQTYQMQDSMTAYSATPYTWDYVENKQNHIYTGKFAPPVPTFTKQEVEKFFKEYDRKRRRIDYIFVSSDIDILSSSLYGNMPNKEGIIGSDHFGVSAVVKLP